MFVKMIFLVTHFNLANSINIIKEEVHGSPAHVSDYRRLLAV